MRSIAILGATGSIGTQALDVCTQRGYGVDLLTAGTNTRLLAEQVRRFKPKYVAIADEKAALEFKNTVKDVDYRLFAGTEGICEAVSLSSADIVLNSIVGIAGLKPTLEVINSKKTLALANKESLVAGGDIVIDLAQKAGVKILPVDSEHSAIFQCLNAAPEKRRLHKIILTASGGAFRGKKVSELEDVTVEQALKHPNWSMGSKITIDSATLMNKGLEVIEAVHLFNVTVDQIQVVVHPESLIHSAVEFDDGAIIAQIGVHDMRIPIQYALTYPDRADTPCERLDLTKVGKMTFEEPDYNTFTCLKTCIDAIKSGGLKPAVANGANEAANKLFLDGRIKFNQIGELVRDAVENQRDVTCFTLDDIFQADRSAREFVLSKI